MASLITLCNQALAEIAKGQVASLNENSIEAREANRFAQPLLDEMIDWSDEIPLGRTRGILAPVANDRAAEWLYAYAEPSDLGSPIAIREVQDDAAAYSLPIAGPFTFPYQDAEPIPFLHEGGVIYTNVETATLVYSRSTITAGDLPPLMQRAFVLELAVRLAAPVAKWDERKIDAKARQAEIAKQRAIADEENKNPRRGSRYISEAEFARHGIGV
jgi:hypothetical protein